MSSIGPEELVRAFRQGRRIAPLNIDDRHIDEMLADIERRRITLHSDAPAVRQLHALIETNVALLKPEPRALMDSQDLFILPYRPCVAFAQLSPKNGRGQIVISEGMITLIAASIYDVYVQKEIPEPLLGCHLTRYRQDVHFVLNAVTFLLRYRFYRYGEPLPRLLDVLSKEGLSHCQIGICGALTFLVLHELAHIALGHIESDNARLDSYEMAVEQTLTPFQKQEAEADQFALECLPESLRDVGSFWMSQSMAFFITMELFTGMGDTQHPLAINRHHVAEGVRLRRRRDNVPFTPPVGSELGKIFEEAARTGPPGRGMPLIETPREAIVDAFVEIVEFLYSAGVDIRGALKMD